MADVSGLALTVLGVAFEVASTIYSYTKDVHGAKYEIQQLSNELFALIGVLERMKVQQEEITSGRSTDHSKAFAQEDNQTSLRKVMQESLEFLQELQDSLAIPKSRFQARLQKLAWPLKDSEVKGHLQRLERVKTYMVLSLMTDEVGLIRQIAAEISALSLTIKGNLNSQREEDFRSKHRKVVEWLSSVDPSQAREKARKSRASGTGVWFTKSKFFETWMDSASSSILWLNGITGAGKTTLMTTVLEEMLSKKGKKDGLAYFYCSFSDVESLDATNIFGSILAQLCSPHDAVYGKLGKLYDERNTQSLGKLQRLEPAVLVDLLIQQTNENHRTFIFLDAINECDDPYKILSYIETLSMWPGTRINICLSSINERGIKDCLIKIPNVAIKTLDRQEMRGDIDLLVRASLEDHPRLQRHSCELKEEIIWALTRGAQGMYASSDKKRWFCMVPALKILWSLSMRCIVHFADHIVKLLPKNLPFMYHLLILPPSSRFRWVYCQLEILSRLRTPGAVRKALVSLPPTLDKAYEELLSRVDGEEDRKLAREILELLGFSLRPMTLIEVSEFLQVTPGIASLDDSKRLTNPKDILSICGSLLNLQGDETGVVTLAHHSIKSYLVSDLKGKASYFKLSASESHRNIAIKCLAYLSFDDFSSGPCSTMSLISNRCKQFPLLDYAAQKWASHTQFLEKLDDSFWTVLKPFLFSGDKGRGNFRSWVQLLIPQSQNISDTSPLYYAASFGLPTIVRYLLDGGAEIESHGGRGGATPINIASFRGYFDVVKILLEYGADPLATDRNPGWNAIQWAQYNNHWKVTELFSNSGYDVGHLKFDRNSARKELFRKKSENVESSPWMESLNVIKVQIEPAWMEDEMRQRIWWQLLCLAESRSKHPAGIAIHQSSKEKLQIVNRQTMLALGSLCKTEVSEYDGISTIVEAINSDTKTLYGVAIGTIDFLAELGVAFPDKSNSNNSVLADNASVLSSPIKSHMHVAIDGIYAGVFLLSNAPPMPALTYPEGGKSDIS